MDTHKAANHYLRGFRFGTAWGQWTRTKPHITLFQRLALLHARPFLDKRGQAPEHESNTLQRASLEVFLIIEPMV